MNSLVHRGSKLRLTAFVLALTIWIFSSSSAMAQHGGHGGGGGGFHGTGHMGGTRNMGGFANRGFGGFGGYGFYPGFYGPGFSGYGYGYSYPDLGAIGTSFGFPFAGYGDWFRLWLDFHRHRFRGTCLGLRQLSHSRIEIVWPTTVGRKRKGRTGRPRTLARAVAAGANGDGRARSGRFLYCERELLMRCRPSGEPIPENPSHHSG